MSSYFEKSQTIKKDAESFLAEKKILTLLSKWGDVLLAGSYSTDLMVWNDIDLQLVLPNSINKIEALTQIARHFLEDPEVKTIQMINFFPGKKPGMPTGIYLGVDYSIGAQKKWKIDIWSLSDHDLQDSVRFNNRMLANLNGTLRELILKLKFDLMGSKARVPQLASHYIYQAIFNENIIEEKEILNFLKNKGITI